MIFLDEKTEKNCLFKHVLLNEKVLFLPCCIYAIVLLTITRKDPQFLYFNEKFSKKSTSLECLRDSNGK